MSRRSRSTSSAHLEIPRKSVELQDPGARELESSDGEEYFSDASEGRRRSSRPVTPSSPIPITRVEKVDASPRHGEIPGTDAYEKRRGDAVPDEIELVPEGTLSKRGSRQFLEPTSPGGSQIPITVVEKVDPTSPSYGDVPGTAAYRQRLADATPDVILSNPDPTKGPFYRDDSSRPRSISQASVPETIVTRADDEIAYGEQPGTRAAELRRADATPDRVEMKSDTAGSPTLDRSINFGTTTRRTSTAYVNEDESDDTENPSEVHGDDFDDFEEGAQAGADDDFGDFDDFEEDFDERQVEQAPPFSLPEQPAHSQFQLVDFDSLSSLPDLLAATQQHFDAMFPSTSEDQQDDLVSQEPIPADSPIFPSDRSRSLWKQLITPPPLQPPNWTQSRIRRLFLISLGVPVDLDEILPPSKQKKLILPDINLSSSSKDGPTNTIGSDKVGADSVSRLKTSKTNDSTVSIDSNQSASKSSRGRARGVKAPPPPPTLDLSLVRRLCTTTEEKLEGFTDDELQNHVGELETLTETTREVLEYWLKRRDGLRKEKEAFEGVIENLVRHAKRVRTIR